MPKGNPKGNPDSLIASAAAKKQEALDKTEKAIAELVKAEETITFKSVARKAGVSVPYLYKHDDIKQRIQYLRGQQKQKPRKKKPKPQSFQPASDQSKATLIYNLKEDNKRLRTEISQKEKHIQVVQGKLYELSMVAEENERLKRQLDKVNGELKTTKAQLDKYLLNNPNVHPKVTPIDSKRSAPKETSLNFIERLSALEIRITPQLNKLIGNKSTEVVENAINAVEEYLATGKQCRSKPGLLRKAIEDEWVPNQSKEEQIIAQEVDEFSEWFKLARLKGYVQASQGTKNGIIVLESSGSWVPWKELILKGITLELLKK